MSRNVVVFGDAQESGVTLAFTPRRDGFGWAMILSEAQARNANKVSLLVSNPGRGKNFLRCGEKKHVLWFQGLRPVCFDCFVPIFLKFFKFIKVGSLCFPMLPP